VLAYSPLVRYVAGRRPPACAHGSAAPLLRRILQRDSESDEARLKALLEAEPAGG
jgi:hypothetical protein